ncbi:MAG: MetQ/NlpA family ABC transporter substrate-binding protein [Evtepia sp.]|uniref:MetQ/NlpA family ABC transporter substrate-binding protein n=1 Tax=Evtepia sp. TaxID=2773933 RepID=UPI002A7657F7|nr:MetQ/NlpA family ABC transporter substrate-binding protein [Evtepia sp.]MDY3014697.1 MetQ/NlpA family ABC transporter substrate-binding protein [Evtepia sp.]
MKKLLALVFALTMVLSLAACGSSNDADKSGDTAGETVTLKVGATPTPHAEILAVVKDDLAKQGINLEVTEYSDYVIPNTAVEDGELDANFFQHITYMEDSNASKGTHLVNAGNIHYEPMGIYAGKTTDLNNIPDGATIAVPNDATNEGRALLLLQDLKLIEINPDAGLNATPNDITSNPKNLKFKELDAAMLAQTREDVDLSIINSNFAIQGGLDPKTDALASEDPQSDAAKAYTNIIAVKEGNENNEAIKALVAALQTEKVKEFIDTTYKGSVVAMF